MVVVRAQILQKKMISKSKKNLLLKTSPMVPAYFKSPLTKGFLLISFSLSTITIQMIFQQMASNIILSNK